MMHNPPANIRIVSLFLLCFFLIDRAVPQALAQTPETAAPSAETAAEELSLATVNASLLEIEALRTALGNAAPAEEFQQRLGQLEDETTRVLDERLQAAPIEAMNRRLLEELQAAVSRQSSQAEAIRGGIASAIEEADTIREKLRVYAQRWETALESPEVAGLPKEAAERVQQAARDAEDAYAGAQARVGELVELEASTLALANRLDGIVAEAEARERVLQEQTFAIVEPPIWAVVAALDLEVIMSDTAAAMGSVQQALQDLATSYQGRLVIHGLLALFMLTAVLVLRRSPMLTSQPELAFARRALAHPVAVALLLSLVPTRFLYPNAQPSVLTLNAMAFLAAELVVLCAVLPLLTALRAWLLGALLVAALSLQFFPGGTPLYRMLLLAVIAGSIGALLALWRIARTDETFRAWRGRRFAQAIVLVFALLLASAFVGNVLGATEFASYAMGAVMRSSLAAVGLATLALVINMLATLVLGSSAASRLRSISNNKHVLNVRLHRAVAWLAIALSVWAALIAFRLREPVVALSQSILGARFEIGELSIAPVSIAFFVLAIWLAVYVSRLTRFFLEEDVLPRMSLPRGVPAIISTSTHYIIIASAFFIGTAAIGFDMSHLAFVAGGLGVGIGFGLQNIVSNFMSGLILLFERPIHVGDNVQVGTLMGVVKRIGVRASVVRTYEGSEVIVPNADLISQQVTNYTLSDRNRRLEIIVGVAYHTDLEHAKEVIEAAVKSVGNVATEPAPLILFQAFGESSLDFRVLFWVHDFDVSLGTSSAVGIAIRKALTREGIEIPFPQRDVHFPEAPRTQEAQAPEALAPRKEVVRTREVESDEGDE